MKTWNLHWKRGELEVQALGGMLGPLNFYLEDGRKVSPLFVAPWGEDSRRRELPPILQRLRGEWPCVPFGSARSVQNLSAAWERNKYEESEGPPHGISSNEEWDLIERTEEELRIGIRYPEEHDIESLQRIIRPRPESAGVDMELQIQVRKATKLPIALHPTFALSKDALGTKLRPGAFEFGLTFPGDLEPGACLLEPNVTFSTLTEVPGLNGTSISLSSLPMKEDTESLVQLCGIDGTFSLFHSEDNYHANIEWNPRHFPSCLLWISNRGRKSYPWNSRNVCLGIEPVNGAFDLGTYTSVRPNPISERGIWTSVVFSPNQIWKTGYSISVS